MTSIGPMNPGRGAILLCVWLFTAAPAAGHAVHRASIKHDVKVAVDPINVDVIIELTFYEFSSLSERRQMDSDHDGEVTSDEIDRYLTGLDDTLAGSLRLSVDGRGLDVIPLFEPEIDLLDVARVAPVHHVLRLNYFARTPRWLRPEGEILVTDRLWPDVAPLTLMEATGPGTARLVVQEDESRTAPDENPNLPTTAPVRALVPAIAGTSAPEGDRSITGILAGLFMVLTLGVFSFVLRGVASRHGKEAFHAKD